MINFDDINQILKAKKCGDLFSNDANKAKEEYRILAKKYHPDINPNAELAFKIITELYQRAEKLFESSDWEISNRIIIINPNGQGINSGYLSEKYFEMGRFYICKTAIIYLFTSTYEKYYNNSIKMIRNINFKDDKIRNQFESYMPKILNSFKTDKDEYCLVISKTSDVFLLEDICKYYNYDIPDRHIAWIISRLSSLSCLFQNMGIVHNGLTLDNCFISPKYHSIIPLGGWWYTTDIQDKMLGVKTETYQIMSVIAKGNKLSETFTDLESTKFIGRKCINDISKLPKPFKEWLEKGSCDSAFKEFKNWNDVLNKSYGKRKFIEMLISEKDIYK